MFIIANEMKCTIYCIKIHVYWDKRKDIIRLSRVLWATIEKVHVFVFLSDQKCNSASPLDAFIF